MVSLVCGLKYVPRSFINLMNVLSVGHIEELSGQMKRTFNNTQYCWPRTVFGVRFQRRFEREIEKCSEISLATEPVVSHFVKKCVV